MGTVSNAARIAPVLLLIAVAASACASDPALVSTETDADRARQAWRDPWAAPETARVPANQYGSNGYVDREAGSRTATYTQRPTQVARTEATAGLAAGWRIAAARCSPELVEVTLYRGRALDDGMRASLVATGEGTQTEATVTTYVPHHADGSWPTPAAAYPIDETCLGGGKSGSDPEADPIEHSKPFKGGAAEAGRDGFDGWERDSFTAEEKDLAAAVSADPWLNGTGLSIGPPPLRTGDSRRIAPSVSGTSTFTATDAAAAIGAMVETMEGWQLTWVSCGAGLPAAATLRLDTDHGSAVVRLRASVTAPGSVDWTVRLPVPEAAQVGEIDDLPVLSSSRCLSAVEPPSGLHVEGTPAVLPSTLQPLLPE